MFAAQRQYCEFSGRNATELAGTEPSHRLRVSSMT